MRLVEEDEVTASPIAWEGRIYLTTGSRLYCLGDAAAAAAQGESEPPAASQVAEATKGPAGEPAWLQVVPAEAQIAAGATLPLTVRLYDAAGRFVKESPAEFSATAGTVAAGFGRVVEVAVAATGSDVGLAVADPLVDGEPVGPVGPVDPVDPVDPVAAEVVAGSAVPTGAPSPDPHAPTIDVATTSATSSARRRSVVMPGRPGRRTDRRAVPVGHCARRWWPGGW
jgi:hypothetical protein